MSGKFNGFTQEDINKLSGKKVRFNAPGLRRVPDKKPPAKSEPQMKPRMEPTVPKEFNAMEVSSTDDSMTSLQEAMHFRPLTSAPIKEADDSLNLTEESILHLPRQNDSPVQIPNSPFKGVSLKDFEVQRKLVEEQNKQKKEMLYKAIEHHSEKTAAEVRKIHEIKAELSKLDSDLALDVSILRKQIESACIQYANIQKHYQQVESQFLKAKLDLHQASEKKELLTEHLCTIIAHNEDRKAQKLSELMQKVGLTPTGELDVPDK